MHQDYHYRIVPPTPQPELPHIAGLRARLAPERFDKYIATAAGDRAAALRLYEWNIDVSAAMHSTIGQLEILLRNALDVQLTRFHALTVGGTLAWWNDPQMPLRPQLVDQLRTARQRARRGGVPETQGKVIAELTFAFWRFLLDASHSATLWAPALRHAFPHLRPRVRTEVYDRLERLNGLRNRTAHHEPIHHLPLEERWHDILAVAGWIDPTTATWIWSTSRVPDALHTRS